MAQTHPIAIAFLLIMAGIVTAGVHLILRIVFTLALYPFPSMYSSYETIVWSATILMYFFIFFAMLGEPDSEDNSKPSKEVTNRTTKTSKTKNETGTESSTPEDDSKPIDPQSNITTSREKYTERRKKPEPDFTDPEERGTGLTNSLSEEDLPDIEELIDDSEKQ